MDRRAVVAVLLANIVRVNARTRASLTRLIEPAQGCALLVDVRTRELIAAHGAPAASAELVPPGSAIKPFALWALLRGHKLSPEELFPCPARLRIGGRSFDCTHPRMTVAMQVPSALAYSCNCFVAHFAGRFERGELAQNLTRAGLGSLPGWGPGEANGRIAAANGVEANQLQALGEEPLVLTAAELAMGYRTIALSAGQAEMAPIIEGLEGAVDYGTAQRAQVTHMKVAGKTGSVRTGTGARMAWFAGFAPSRAPEVVVTVMLQARSGGADAAPVAGRILEAWRAGRFA